MATCKECSITETVYWTRCEGGTFICNDCYVKNELKKKEERELKIKVEQKQESPPKVAVRKSARIRTVKSFTKSAKSPKEKFVPKQINYAAPEPVLVALESNHVFCNNQRFQRGDIVSIESEDGDVLYAQLKGFLTDQYCRKSTVITWLLPTRNSPPSNECFDPSTYVIGCEEDTPRPLDQFKYVMHAPSEYYMDTSAQYPPITGDPFKCGYIPDPTL